MWLETTPATAPARRRLVSLGTFGLIGLGLSATYRLFGVGVPCPWRVLTGTLCPFCGSTHLGADLLNLDFAGAWASNQFVFSVGVIVALASVFWIIEALGGPKLRLRPGLTQQRVWMGTLTVVAIGFTIVRNL